MSFFGLFKKKTDMKEATRWCSYDTTRHKFVEHHIVLKHVPKDREKPKTTGDKIKKLWESMKWKKVYGYYDQVNAEFVKSKRLNNE